MPSDEAADTYHLQKYWLKDMRSTVKMELKCPGVGRDKDHGRALCFYFNRPVTDDEMRFLHEVVQRAVACMPRPAEGMTMWTVETVDDDHVWQPIDNCETLEEAEAVALSVTSHRSRIIRYYDARPGRSEKVAAETRVLDDLQVQLGRLTLRSNELYRMVKFLREHEGECIEDHPDWIAGLDKLLDGEHFDALTELKHLFR